MAFRMCGRVIVNQRSIEAQCSDCWRTHQFHVALLIEQFSAAGPQLQKKIIDRVVAVWESGKYRSVEATFRALKKASYLVELFPGRRRAKVRTMQSCIGGLLPGILK